MSVHLRLAKMVARVLILLEVIAVIANRDILAGTVKHVYNCASGKRIFLSTQVP